MMKISNMVKYFLKNYSHLLDENKESEFLDELWEEGMHMEEVIELFSILNLLNPPPVSKEVREKHALNTLKHLIEIANNLTPEEWSYNYYYESAIDEDGDLILGNLLKGFRMHSYGFGEEEFTKLARANKDKIGWDGGEIYW